MVEDGQEPKVEPMMDSAVTVESSKTELTDIAEDTRSLRESVEAQFNINQLKEKYRQQLLQQKDSNGNPVFKEEDADLAVQKFFDNLYVFQPPDENAFSVKLAKLYVRRGKIAKKYGVPLAGLAVAGVLGYGALEGVNAVRLGIAERNVESAVEASYRESRNLNNELNDLDSQKNLLADSSELAELVKSAEESLMSTEEFYNAYCSEGTASDDITRLNYSDADQNLHSINRVIGSVKIKVSQGQAMVKLEKDLVSTRKSLDSLIQEIKSSNPPEVLHDRAESAYNSGVASISNGQLNDGISYQNQLSSIKSDVKDFEILPSRLNQIYSSIKTVSKDPEANTLAEDLMKEGQNYVTAVNVASLKSVISSLENLDSLLKQEFTVKIVSRSGVKSGMDRYYTDASGRRLSGFYLIVEALDENGRPITRQITNEEDHRTYSTNLWGERVPQEIYEAVKKDKMNDGRVDNNIFSEKKSGYLKEVIVFPGVSQRSGQITRW